MTNTRQPIADVRVSQLGTSQVDGDGGLFCAVGSKPSSLRVQVREFVIVVGGDVNGTDPSAAAMEAGA